MEQQLLLFQKAMDAAEEGAVALRNANSALAASEAKAVAEAGASLADTRRLGVQVGAWGWGVWGVSWATILWREFGGGLTGV